MTRLDRTWWRINWVKKIKRQWTPISRRYIPPDCAGLVSCLNLEWVPNLTGMHSAELGIGIGMKRMGHQYYMQYAIYKRRGWSILSVGHGKRRELVGEEVAMLRFFQTALLMNEQRCWWVRLLWNETWCNTEARKLMCELIAWLTLCLIIPR